MAKHAIGMLNERSLHAALIQHVSHPGDQFEVKLNTHVIDIVRGELLIEVQTRSLAKLKKKLTSLLSTHKVRVVLPVVRRKWIVRLNKKDKQLGRKRSPLRGRLLDIFHELVDISDIVAQKNFSLQAVMVEVEEIRRADGEGSWRRKGQSIVDTKLLEVIDEVVFDKPKDYLIFLPQDLPVPFSNKQLAERLRLDVHDARKVTYVLRKTGTIKQVGKSGNELLFRRTHKTQGT